MNCACQRQHFRADNSGIATASFSARRNLEDRANIETRSISYLHGRRTLSRVDTVRLSASLSSHRGLRTSRVGRLRTRLRRRCLGWSSRCRPTSGSRCLRDPGGQRRPSKSPNLRWRLPALRLLSLEHLFSFPGGIVEGPRTYCLR